MTFDYRVIPLPSVWPGRSTPDWQRRRAPFKSVPGRALRLLAREIGMLNGKNVRIAIDVRDHQIKLDGQLYANARARTPAVIVIFDTKDGTLQFPCDTFTFWEANVDAIARALEALRMVDRYGVQQGRQYAGYKQLPSSTAPTMNAALAAQALALVNRELSADTILLLQHRADRPPRGTLPCASGCRRELRAMASSRDRARGAGSALRTGTMRARIMDRCALCAGTQHVTMTGGDRLCRRCRQALAEILDGTMHAVREARAAKAEAQRLARRARNRAHLTKARTKGHAARRARKWQQVAA